MSSRVPEDLSPGGPPERSSRRDKAKGDTAAAYPLLRRSGGSADTTAETGPLRCMSERAEAPPSVGSSAYPLVFPRPLTAPAAAFECRVSGEEGQAYTLEQQSEQRIEETCLRLHRILRRRERQRQIYHGFTELQDRGFATHVRPGAFEKRVRRVRLCRIPKLLLRRR